MPVSIQDSNDKPSTSGQQVIRPYKGDIELGYGYTLVMHKGAVSNTIRCEYTIKCIGKSVKSGNLIYRINRVSPVYINDKAPDSLAEELAAQINTVIYPLEVETDAKGTTASLSNHAQILSRWAHLKPDLLEYYEGEDMRKYIELSEQALQKADFLLERLQQDWFLNTFFSPICGNYHSSIVKQQYLYLPISDSSVPVQYLTTWSLDNEPNEHGEIEVKALGEVEEDRCKLDLEQENDFPYYRTLDRNATSAVGSYKLAIKLDSKSHLIESITCESDLLLQDPISIKINIYNIGNKTPIPSSLETSSFIVADQWVEKKEGFWNKLFKR